MLEYGAVMVGGLREDWTAQILPVLDAIRSTPYFWPGGAAVAVTFLLFTRQFTK